MSLPFTNRFSRRSRAGLAWVLLALVVVFGLRLRLAGLGWSLPDARHPLATYHPDELINLAAARTADIPHAQFDIGFYNYGAFYFYLVSFAHTLGRGYGLIPTTPAPPPGLDASALMALAAPENAALFLTGRLVTALLGAATIPVLFALGSRLYGRKVGLLAGLFYAVAPLAVLHAHFLTVDVPATFFITLALLAAARLLDDPSWKNYVWAGVTVGLCAATKYNCALVLVAPLSAALSTRSRASSAPSASRSNSPDSDTASPPNPPDPPNASAPLLPGDKKRAAKIGALLGVMVLTFLIACPGPWLNWNAFWNGLYPGSGVRYELFEHSRQGHGLVFVNTGLGWRYNLEISLCAGLGLPLLALSLLGAGLALWRRQPADVLLLAFLLLYYFVAGFSAVRFARYMLPLYPALCLLAARLVLQSAKRDIARGLWVVAAGVCLFNAWLNVTFMLNGPLQGKDARDAAADYLERAAGPGATVGFATLPWFYSPPLSPLFGAVRPAVRAQAAQQTRRFRLLIPEGEWDARVLDAKPDYVVVSTLETADAVTRLRLPAAVNFMRRLETGPYTKHIFTPMLMSAFVPRTGEDIPQDMLYVLSVITVYRKN